MQIWAVKEEMVRDDSDKNILHGKCSLKLFQLAFLFVFLRNTLFSCGCRKISDREKAKQDSYVSSRVKQGCVLVLALLP